MSDDELQNHVNEENSFWTERDIDCRNALLDATFHPSSCITPILPPDASPEISNLICLPKDEIRSKLANFLSSVSLVASLLLAGVIESGLDPMDCNVNKSKSMMETHKDELLCNINNYLSIVLITLDVTIVLFTFYLLTQLEVESAENILRVASRAGGIVHYQFGVFISGIIVLIKISIGNFMYTTGHWKLVSCGVVCSILLICWSHYFLCLGKMFPMVTKQWARRIYPMVGVLDGGDLSEVVRRAKISLKKGAVRNFGSGVVNDRESAKKNKANFEQKEGKNMYPDKERVDLEITSSNQEINNKRKKEEEVAEETIELFLNKALSSNSSQTRKRDMAKLFVREGITGEMICEASRNGTLVDLLTAMSRSSNNSSGRERLLAGEIISLNSNARYI